MNTQAKKAAVDAALSIAEDVTTGKLTPGTLEAQAAAECRALFRTVIGPDDPLWELHLDVMRQAIALGGMSGEELAEWAVVFKPKDVEPPPKQSWIERLLGLGNDDDEADGDV